MSRVLLCVAALAFIACGGGGGGSQNSSDGDDSDQTIGRNLVSTCGTAVDGKLKNPVSNGEYVLVEPLRADTVIITRTEGEQAGNQQIVKLHGVNADRASSASNEFAIEVMQSMLRGEGVFVSAGKDCSTASAAGQGVLGHIYSTSGKNVNELILQTGAVTPAADACGGELLTACYGGFSVVDSDDVIADFLWKPESDSDGNLVVLVDPYDVTVVVRGAITETLRNVGPGNGRGTQARANRPGCAYGANARVEFYDYRGLRIKTASGQSSITVANGCARTELLF